MLHTKFQGHRPFRSGEEDFLKVFTIYGHDGHLGHVTKTVWTNFRSLVLRRFHVKSGFNRPSGFRGEDVWKWWHTYIHTYGWQGSPYTILNKNINFTLFDEPLRHIGDIWINKPYAHEFGRCLGFNWQTCSIQFCINQELQFFVWNMYILNQGAG